MNSNKILGYFLFVMLLGVTSQSAFSHDKNFTINSVNSSNKVENISDSISKGEIAEYRKSFESVEKMISRKMGSYADAKNSFNGISGSRVRNLPEFAGRYSAMQQKLSAWNLEVNPKQPPVVVPHNPSNPKNNNNEKNAKDLSADDKNTGDIERKSSMLSYFPDTLTIGNDFLAYVEISKNSIQYGNRNGNINSMVDSIVIGSSGLRTAVMNSSVTVDLSIDGGNQNFTINPRFDSKTKVINENDAARWEWMMHPNAEGDYRLRLNVKYQKQNKDGSMQEATAITKVFLVKGLPKKSADTASNNMLWIILGLVVLIAIVAIVLMSGKSKRNARYKDEQIRNEQARNEQARNEQIRNEQIRNEQIRKDQNRNDLNK